MPRETQALKMYEEWGNPTKPQMCDVNIEHMKPDRMSAGNGILNFLIAQKNIKIADIT